MIRTIALTAALCCAATSAMAADPGRGNSNNKNAEVFATAVFDPVPEIPFLSFAFCSQINPNAANGRNNRGGAYARQGDEGLNKAFNTTLCIVEPNSRTVIVPEVFEWPDEGCTIDGDPWDDDPLPNEVTCPEL